MAEKQIGYFPKALKIHPELLNSVLEPRPNRLPDPLIGNLGCMIDPLFMYDGELLNKRLASIPITGIDTVNLRTVVGKTLDRQNDLAYGRGPEGAIREILTPSIKKTEPFTSSSARFDCPGEIWALTADHGKVVHKDNKIVDTVAYGLVPLAFTINSIDTELQRRQMFPNTDPLFEIQEIRVLPKVMADYTRALQGASRETFHKNERVDVQTFRNIYFKLNQQQPDMTGIFKKIKQEYLGNTTWGTILFSELLIRMADYGIGLIPIVGSIWDISQASTGKEFPIPGTERIIRRGLREQNLPLPEGVFDKPIRGRLIEIADALIGLAPMILPPAWIAKVPLDYIIEGLLYVDKMHNTRKYFKSFMEIAADTGTKPKAIDKVQEIGKIPGAVIKQTWNKIFPSKPS